MIVDNGTAIFVFLDGQPLWRKVAPRPSTRHSEQRTTLGDTGTLSCRLIADRGGTRTNPSKAVVEGFPESHLSDSRRHGTEVILWTFTCLCISVAPDDHGKSTIQSTRRNSTLYLAASPDHNMSLDHDLSVVCQHARQFAASSRPTSPVWEAR